MGEHLNDHLSARQSDALTRNTLPIGEAYLTFLFLQRIGNKYATRIPYLQGEERATMQDRYYETLSQVELAQVALAQATQAASQAILADGAEVARTHLTDLLVEIGVVPTLGLLDELVEAVTAILGDITE